MDWNRAKTILIISFIILDLFLAAQLNQMMEKKSRYLESNKITDEQIHELMEVNQIKLATPFPKQLPKISVQQAAISHFTGWKSDEKWTYHKTFPGGIPYKNEEELKAHIRKQVPQFEQYQPVKEKGNVNQRVFIQKLNSFFIFDSTLICKVQNGKLLSLQVLHFKLKKEVPVEFISINNALSNMITSGKLPNHSIITHIELGYRSLYSSTPQEVILVPVWRIRANQTYYYANATNATTGTLNDSGETVQ